MTLHEPAAKRALPGWSWGLIIAGTAVVALLVGGGLGWSIAKFQTIRQGQSAISWQQPDRSDLPGQPGDSDRSERPSAPGQGWQSGGGPGSRDSDRGDAEEGSSDEDGATNRGGA